MFRTQDPPEAVRATFADYPGMGRAADVRALVAAGPWRLVEHFELPDEAWWTDFYTPMERRIATLRQHYATDVEARAVLDQLAGEPKLHREHGRHYGYDFFVVQRT